MTMTQTVITNAELDFIHLCDGFDDMSRDNLYAFDAMLCHNGIDEDNDCIPTITLERIAVLCRGVQFYNNNALIYGVCFDQNVERTVAGGETYVELIAKICIKINDDTRQLISDIESGKRTAVECGVSFSDRVCSICGANKNVFSCRHEKGIRYDGELAYDILKQPDEILSVAITTKGNITNKGGVGMTRERADEIEHMVFYKNLHLPTDAPPDVAYHFGRMVGRMQESLRRELAKEVERCD